MVAGIEGYPALYGDGEGSGALVGCLPLVRAIWAPDPRCALGQTVSNVPQAVFLEVHVGIPAGVSTVHERAWDGRVLWLL